MIETRRVFEAEHVSAFNGGVILESWDWVAEYRSPEVRWPLEAIIADIEGGIRGMGFAVWMAVATSDARYVDDLDGTEYRIVEGRLIGRA